nr:hypothetical protein CFP56_32216 [Quercus suber]
MNHTVGTADWYLARDPPCAERTGPGKQRAVLLIAQSLLTDLLFLGLGPPGGGGKEKAMTCPGESGPPKRYGCVRPAGMTSGRAMIHARNARLHGIHTWRSSWDLVDADAFPHCTVDCQDAGWAVTGAVGSRFPVMTVPDHRLPGSDMHLMGTDPLMGRDLQNHTPPTPRRVRSR